MNKKSVLFLFLVAFILLLVSCDGGEQATDPAVVETKPSSSNQIPPNSGKNTLFPSASVGSEDIREIRNGRQRKVYYIWEPVS